jgi:hypothetical protein
VSSVFNSILRWFSSLVWAVTTPVIYPHNLSKCACTYPCPFWGAYKDDLSFNFEYEHLIWMAWRTAVETAPSKLVSSTPGNSVLPLLLIPARNQFPPLWIDRVGFKANITEVCPD